MKTVQTAIPNLRLTRGAETLEHRLAFERVLTDLSARFANVSAASFGAEIEDALRKLIEVLGFERSAFAEILGDSSLVVVGAASVPGVPVLDTGTLAGHRWYIGQLRAGRPVVLPSLPQGLPPEAADELAYVQRVGMTAHVGVPLSVGGKVCACLGFASFGESRWVPDRVIDRLILVGEMFAQALYRMRADAELRKVLDEVGRLKDRLEAENDYLRRVTQVQAERDLASRSPRFRRLVEDLQRVASTSATVLLQGETGTGKEVLAEAIHQMSPRRQQPMVRVNCAALPAGLIEAELFGRERGAFTGSLTRQIGRFELADASTILLDEVGELPLELQPKLLRVLQNGEFERVGGTQTIRVDARIVAATNRDLAQAVADGHFRRDLFYRLNVFPIDVPPLRERREDVQTLAWVFIKEFGDAMGKRIERIDDDSLQAMETYSWPGNVRELRNAVERAMILATGRVLHVGLSKQAIQPNMPAETLEDAERAHILAVLARTGWRIRGSGGAAAILGVKPTTLESRLQKLSIRRPG
jgi:transcriptional regulator with GAF, ATPase, and Fis domain